MGIPADQKIPKNKKTKAYKAQRKNVNTDHKKDTKYCSKNNMRNHTNRECWFQNEKNNNTFKECNKHYKNNNHST